MLFTNCFFKIIIMIKLDIKKLLCLNLICTKMKVFRSSQKEG